MPLLNRTAPWNIPTSFKLLPGETRGFALRLQVARGGPRTSSETLRASGSPILQGVPGFVLGADMKSATLHVTPSVGVTTLGVQAIWSQGDAKLTFSREKQLRAAGVDTFTVIASGRGRVTAAIALSDGTNATAHYFVVPSFRGQARMCRLLPHPLPRHSASPLRCTCPTPLHVSLPACRYLRLVLTSQTQHGSLVAFLTPLGDRPP